MGGNQEQFKKSEQMDRLTSDLSEVKYFVDFSKSGNPQLLNLDKIYDELSSLITKYLDDIGIKHTDIGKIGRGGGGFESIKEIIETFLQNLDLFLLIGSLFNVIKNSYDRYLDKKAENLKPNFTFVAWIDSDSEIDKLSSNEVHIILSPRLANLLSVSDAICNLINEKYSFFNYDFTVEAKVKNINFSVRLNLYKNKNIKKNLINMLNVIKSLKVKKNLTTTYEPWKWKLMKRTDSMNKKNKKYYLLELSPLVINKF